MDESLTSFCGLCCSDCIPSRESLFALADGLDRELAALRFEEYAALKGEGDETFRDYSVFLSVLRAIRELRCPGPCREGGGRSRCAVRDCAQDRGCAGCWECEERPCCERLDRLRAVHPHLDAHLDLIRELGPADWFKKRREHYRWQVRE